MNPRPSLGRIVLVVLSVLLTLGVSGLLAFAILSLPFLSSFAALRSSLMALTYVASALLLAHLIVRRLLGLSPRDCRLLPIRVRPVWAITALLLPAMVIFLLSRFEGQWVFKGMTGETLKPILVGGIATPIVEEVLFRGVLMTALEQRYSRVMSIVAPSVLFTILHLVNGQADLTSLLLLMLAGTTVGTLFSLITYESGSIANSMLVHASWNLTASVILFNGSAQSHYLANYQLVQNHYVWLGGTYATDASPVSIVGYILCIVLALVLLRRQRMRGRAR